MDIHFARSWRNIAILAVSLFAAVANAADIVVSSATPSSAEQGTLALLVTIKGSNFPRNPVVRFCRTDTGSTTCDPDKVTVRSARLKGSGTIEATIDVGLDATTTNFDIEVIEPMGGRKGRGTALFSVTDKKLCIEQYPGFAFTRTAVKKGKAVTEIRLAGSEGCTSQLLVTDPDFRDSPEVHFDAASGRGLLVWVAEPQNAGQRVIKGLAFSISNGTVMPQSQRILYRGSESGFPFVGAIDLALQQDGIYRIVAYAEVNEGTAATTRLRIITVDALPGCAAGTTLPCPVNVVAERSGTWLVECIDSAAQAQGLPGAYLNDDCHFASTPKWGADGRQIYAYARTSGGSATVAARSGLVRLEREVAPGECRSPLTPLLGGWCGPELIMLYGESDSVRDFASPRHIEEVGRDITAICPVMGSVSGSRDVRLAFIDADQCASHFNTSTALVTGWQYCTDALGHQFPQSGISGFDPNWRNTGGKLELIYQGIGANEVESTRALVPYRPSQLEDRVLMQNSGLADPID